MYTTKLPLLFLLTLVTAGENFVLRPGEPTKTHSCGHVRTVPDELRKPEVMRPEGLSTFYKKYTEAYGIPIISSSRVSDSALQRACYTVRFLLADSAEVRYDVYKMGGRFAVIGKNEKTTDIPEHSYLPDSWNARARGAGAMVSLPISTAGEENALCFPKGQDRYWDEDIVLHEGIHILHNIGLKITIPTFNAKLQRLYNNAMKAGIWGYTYAKSNIVEYFAETAQSYFNVNRQSQHGNADGIHNHVNLRTELRHYDPAITGLFNKIFACNNTYIPRCDPSKTIQEQREAEINQELKMDCTKIDDIADFATCSDFADRCGFWSSTGECQKNPHWMKTFCAVSCGAPCTKMNN